jgi:hypothetical protein
MSSNVSGKLTFGFKVVVEWRGVEERVDEGLDDTRRIFVNT